MSVFAAVLRYLPAPLAPTRIPTVTALPAALPQFSLPPFSLEGVRKTVSIAVAITMLGLTEAVSISRAIALRSEQRVDGNQEFIGQGLSNIVGSFFSAYASSGSFNRSGLNYEAGAKTPLASVFAALMLIVILLLVAPLARYLPIPRWRHPVPGRVGPHRLQGDTHDRAHEPLGDRRARRHAGRDADRAARVRDLHRRAALAHAVPQPHVAAPHRRCETRPDRAQLPLHDAERPSRLPAAQDRPVNGSIFFGAVDHVQGVLQKIDAEKPTQKHLLIDATGINFIDIAGAEMLALEAKRRRRLGGGLYLYRVNDEVMELLTRGGYLEESGRKTSSR